MSFTFQPLGLDQGVSRTAVNVILHIGFLSLDDKKDGDLIGLK